MRETVDTKVELKYCECCGGLMLRPAHGRQTYCGFCAPLMQEVAVPKKPVQPARLESIAARRAGGVACA